MRRFHGMPTVTDFMSPLTTSKSSPCASKMLLIACKIKQIQKSFRIKRFVAAQKSEEFVVCLRFHFSSLACVLFYCRRRPMEKEYAATYKV